MPYLPPQNFGRAMTSRATGTFVFPPGYFGVGFPSVVIFFAIIPRSEKLSPGASVTSMSSFNYRTNETSEKGVRVELLVSVLVAFRLTTYFANSRASRAVSGRSPPKIISGIVARSQCLSSERQRAWHWTTCRNSTFLFEPREQH